MAEAAARKKKGTRLLHPPPWFWRGWVALCLLAGFVWLGVWLTERTYKTPSKKRNFQSWLEDSLNADVSIPGGVVVRLNLARRSRLVLRNVEVDHPNALFPGKFVVGGEIGSYAEPWSVFGLWEDRLNLSAHGVRVRLEENESGEWNIAGLMNPLAAPDSRFPFPVPKFTQWRMDVADSELVFRRPGNEVRLGVDAEIQGSTPDGRVVFRARQVPFSHVRDGDSGAMAKSGRIAQATVVARVTKRAGESPALTPVTCEMRLENLPLSMLPLFFPNIPLEESPGLFNGSFTVRETAAGSYQAVLEGDLLDAPLAIFGLPNNTPFKAVWPAGRAAAGGEAVIHLGPSGFGGFDIRVSLDALGKADLLAMRGDVARLDDLPSLLTRHSRWLDWLSHAFATIEWKAGKWLGFGWSGNAMSLSLGRMGAGLNLTGEAELMNGTAKIAMTPGQARSPIVIMAENLDPRLLGAKLAQLLPDAFRIQVAGEGANFTWRSRHPERSGGGEAWSMALVFSKPAFDVRTGGGWWRKLAAGPLGVADALPEWGGGDPVPLARMAENETVALEQLSIVSETAPGGDVRVEFVTNGGGFEAGGWVEAPSGLPLSGDMFFTGEPNFLVAAESANPVLGRTLRLLARRSLGLRTTYRLDGEGEVEFSLPFLDDAKRLKAGLDRDGGLAEDGRP